MEAPSSYLTIQSLQLLFAKNNHGFKCLGQILVTFPLGRISESGEFLLVFCVHGLCSVFAKFIAFIEKILDPAFIPTLAYRDDNRLARFAFPIVSVSLV